MYTDLVLRGKGKEIQSKTMFENLESKISNSLREYRIFYVIYTDITERYNIRHNIPFRSWALGKRRLEIRNEEKTSQPRRMI